MGVGRGGMATRGIRGVRRLTLASLAIGMMSTAPSARAQNASWLVSPGSGDFNTAANWSPAAVPTGTASFGFSNTTALSFSADTSIGGFTLNSGASAYNFTVGAGRTVTFTGAGITINGGSATFTNAYIVNFDNASTAGTATINNNNTLAFHNSATAGGSTIVNNDFLQFFDGTSAGSSTLTNNNNTSFFATSTAGSANITNSSVVAFYQTSTAGSATINNNNTLAFNNSATAGSSTIVNNDFLQFFDGTSAGSSTLTNNNNTSFFATSTAGSANITNNSVVAFYQTSTAGSATITNTSSLTFNDSATAGNATITNSSSGLTQFVGNSTGGNARLINQAGGTFDFSGSSGPNGDGRVSAGSIEGAGTFNLGANTLTVGSNNLSTTVSGLIQDGGAGGGLVKTGTGTLTLAGTATYAGPTTINGGTLLGGATNAFSAASATTINSGGTLNLGGFAQTINSVSLAGGILQNGNLAGAVSSSGGTINGLDGTARLTMLSGTTLVTGTNGYTGLTLVTGGTLEVDGSITSSSATNVSGTLSGTGEVRRVAIETGGTLAPGSAANPTGTLTIMTNLAFQSGAFYLVQVGAGASNINVVGTASVANATVQVAVTGGVQGSKSYDIVHTTTGIGGTRFSGIQSLSPGFTETLSYTATDVSLSLIANLGGGAGGSGLSGNQQKIANTINTIFNSGGTLPAGFVNLFNLSGVSLSNALTQISGETATGSQQATFDAMGMFMGLLTDPFMNRTGGFGAPSPSSGYTEENAYAARSNPTDAFAMFTKAPPVAPTFEQRWSVWAAGFGGSQNTSGNAVVGSNNTTSNIAGTAVGADYLLSPNTIAGFALAGGGTSFNVANGGTGRSDLFQFGAYVRHNQGPAYISAALAYGWQDITTNRTVTVAGFDQLRAQFNANAWSGRVEGGYRVVSPATFGVGITPYAAAQFVTFDLPAYAEQAIVGSNQFAQAYGAHDPTDVRTELGIRTDKSWLVNDGILTLRGRLAWAHDYDPDRSIGATFQTLPGASFVVNGAAQAADSALTTASVEMKWRNGWSAAATFEGEFSNATTSYAGKGVVRYQW